MQINVLNKQNIFTSKSNYQTNVQNQRFNSISNDVFIKTQPAFTSINPLKILTSFEKFDISEYKSLEQNQIFALRRFISKKVQENKNVILDFSNIIKTNLNAKYPEGYVFVVIGRSHAVIGKALEYQGIDVKYCPMSNLRYFDNNLFKEKLLSEKMKGGLLSYNKYLKEIKLSEEEIKKNNKKYIFTDYTRTGTSLINFKYLINSPEINISSPNILYKSLNDDILNPDNSNLLKSKLKHYFKRNVFKDYSPFEKLDCEDLLKVKNIISAPQSDQCKQMQFALIDYLAQKGLLKE